MQKWEYKIISPSMNGGSDQSMLSRMGKEGWENYAVVLEGNSALPTFYFKRPLQIPATTEQKEGRLIFR